MKFKEILIYSVALILLPTCSYADSVAEVVCDIYQIATGRYVRALVIIVIIGIGYQFLTGSMKFDTVRNIIVAMAFIFGAGSITVLVLASRIGNISGEVNGRTFYKNRTYSPSEIIHTACPSALL